MICCRVRFHTFPTHSVPAIQSLFVAVLHVQARRPVAGIPRHPRVSPPLPFFSPSFLPRLFFLRPFAPFSTRLLSFHLGWRGFVRRVWFVRFVPVVVLLVRVVVLHRSREKQGRIQLGFSSNPVRGSPGDVSHDVSRVSQPSGVRVRRWGELGNEGSGVRENVVSRVALPSEGREV